MRIHNTSVSTLLVISLLALVVIGQSACGGGRSGPDIPMPADPKAASQESLETLFGEISVQLQSAKPGSKAELALRQKLDTVGSELAQREAAAIRTRLASVERVDGKIPQGALERELGALEGVKRWNVVIYTEIKNEIGRELDATRREVGEQEKKLAALDEQDTLERINLLSSLSALSGTGSEAQARYAAQRDEIIRNVSQEAKEAIENEDYERAQDLLGIVQEVNPEDEAARQQKCEVDGKVIVKRFNAAMETGRLSKTRAMLEEFSQQDCFDEIKAGLASDAATMVEAFGLFAQEATSAGDLSAAYQRYRDASVISELLLDQKPQLPGIDTFSKGVDQRSQKAFEVGEYGVAWGLLNVMTEFGPITPQIRQRLRKTRDEIARRAVRGLTAYPFEDPKTSATKVGDAVSSKVVQHIFRTIPSDVRIVEREQLERILEECNRRGTCSELDTADYIVQGTILDAKVETTEKSGRETRRVVTGREAVTNPDYTAWSNLKERERERTPEPPRTVARDVTEDVTIEVRSVRKVGIVSVSYRIVEASSGRVLVTDSIQTKQEFQDEGRQGVQLGNFRQETDFVELPPDIEILSGSGGLADKISEEIGIKLVEFLKDPEEQYSANARRFVNEGDYLGASRMAAYSIVLRDLKDKDMGTLREDLKDYAMESPTL
jgi:hypothetical protein